MSQQRFSEMSEAEYDTLVDGHIERTVAGADEMPVDVFFAVLLDLITDLVLRSVMV